MTTSCKITKSNSVVAGMYYYVGLAFLLILFGIALYWQLEKDPANFEFTSFSVTTVPSDRSFYVPISFCSTKINKFTVSRVYKDIKHNILHTVPNYEYHTDLDTCSTTILPANTGRLEKGEYEYRIYVSYSINPLRSQKTKVALIYVTVE